MELGELQQTNSKYLFDLSSGILKSTGSIIYHWIFNRAVLVDLMSGLAVKPMSYILFGATSGFIGSMIDSVLVRRFSRSSCLHLQTSNRLDSHTFLNTREEPQATYYDENKKCIHSCVNRDDASKIIHDLAET